MTQTEKARAYDEALERARKLKENPQNVFNEYSPKEGDTICDYIFPELKEESDDEKIKHEIKVVLANTDLSQFALEYTFADMLAWLEKQGEQKPIIEMKSAEESLGIDSETYNKIVDECIYGKQKLEEKPETAFHEGDWIVQENIGVYKVIEVCESWYEIIDNQNNHYSIGFDKEYMCHLWSIKDAKDGDVLAYNDSKNNVWVCIFKEYANERVYDYCTLDKESFWECGNWDYLASFSYKPATKKQCDLLFQKMKEAGYEWNAEKKELKKFDFSKPIKYNSNPPSIVKEFDWSEDDEKMLVDAYVMLDWYKGNNWWTARRIKDWLNSLKERIIG